MFINLIILLLVSTAGYENQPTKLEQLPEEDSESTKSGKTDYDDEILSDQGESIVGQVNSTDETEQNKMIDVITKSSFKWKIMNPSQITITSTFVLTHLWKVAKLFHWNLLIEGIKVTLLNSLQVDENHPNYNDYFHDCKKIVTDGIAQRRSYATKQIQKVLKRKFLI
jgi:hypothetical protein